MKTESGKRNQRAGLQATKAGAPRRAARIVASEVGTGVVYEQDGVTITAFDNNHGELIDPSNGHRIDYDGRSAVISGDTKWVDSVVEMSRDVDLLVHSIGTARQELLDSAPIWQRIMDHHIEPETAWCGDR